MCRILKSLFLQKNLANIFILHIECQKRCFEVHFDKFIYLKNLAVAPTPNLSVDPLLLSFTAVSEHPKGRRIPDILWSAARRSASHNPYQFPVS